MTDFAKDLNLRGNKLKKAKVEILDRNSIANDDVVDKQYVDDTDTYSSTLTANTSIQPTRYITDRTLLHQRTKQQIFDALFYERVPHDYLLPISTMTVRYVSPGTNTDIDIEPGTLVDLRITFSTNFRSSAGLDTASNYNLTGTGGINQTGITAGTVTISNYTVQLTNSFQLTTHYLAAPTQNDSFGDPDPAGSTTHPKFNAGSITTNVVDNVIWPWYLLVLDGDVAVPNASSLNTALSSGKNRTTRPSVNTVTVPAGSTKTVFFAVSIGTSTTIPTGLSVIKDNALPVTSSFTGQVITAVADVTASGLTQNYAIWKSTNGVGFSTAAQYELTL